MYHILILNHNFLRIFPKTPMTKKPNDVRLGRGKGNVKYWFSFVKKNDVLIEIRSFDDKLAKIVLTDSKIKFPIKTFIFNRQKR